MNRHTPSFLVSVLVHISFGALIFLLYKSATVISAKKEEKKVCIHLQTLQTTTSAVIPKKIVVPKKMTTIPKVKTVEHKIKKKKEEKKKKVFHKKVVKQKIVPKKEKHTEAIPSVKKTEPKKEIVEEEIPQIVPVQQVQRVEKTPTELYVDENLQKISQLLSDNLYYPRRARKRGIEGVVNVDFTLSTEAVVSEINVVSSGSDILSRAAIKTLEELSGEFPHPRETLRLSVPINYSLKR